jgi:hypothetical protein
MASKTKAISRAVSSRPITTEVPKTEVCKTLTDIESIESCLNSIELRNLEIEKRLYSLINLISELEIYLFGNVNCAPGKLKEGCLKNPEQMAVIPRLIETTTRIESTSIDLNINVKYITYKLIDIFKKLYTKEINSETLDFINKLQENTGE